MEEPRRIPLIRVLFSGLVMIAFGLGIYRFYSGLGPSTNLSDNSPWGLWIGLDMLSGVALAAGGFVLAAVVNFFGMKKYEVFVRPAVATAFLGYMLAVIGLLLDLGRPWAIWHPMVMWQPHSIMFEVAWCVILYTTVLFLEFLPVVFEKFKMARALRAINRYMILFIFAGVILSTLHQSSLGSLFVMMGHKMHPLWYTPMLPVFFLVSAAAVGIAMVIFESILSGLIYGHRHPTRLLGDLARALPPILGVYLGLKIMDLNARDALGRLLDNDLESWACIIELALGAFLPGTLLLFPQVRYNRMKLFGCVTAVCTGVVMNRLNVCMVSMIGTSTDVYLPSWIEVMLSAGVIAGGLLVLSVMNQTLPISREPQENAKDQPIPASP